MGWRKASMTCRCVVVYRGLLFTHTDSLSSLFLSLWFSLFLSLSFSLSDCGFGFWFCFDFLLWVSVHLQVYGGGGGVGLLWWWWGWVHCGFTKVATDLGGDWSEFRSVWVVCGSVGVLVVVRIFSDGSWFGGWWWHTFLWVILMVTELVFVPEFGGRCCLCLPERETKKLRGKRDGRGVRELMVFSVFKNWVWWHFGYYLIYVGSGGSVWFN